MRSKAYSHAIAVLIDGWDNRDPWGSAMSVGFAIGEVSDALGLTEPQMAMGYRRGISLPSTLDDLAGDDEDLSIALLAQSVLDGRVTHADLLRGARVISRYLDLCKRAGVDY